MKKLYSEFNKLNIDTDLQPMEVSDFEKEKVKRTIMKGKRKNHLPRNLSAAAAFLVASSIALSVAFPTYAAKLPIVGSIFELFNDDDTYVFENHNTHATNIGVTKESNGISVTVTDAVYDGENITIAYTMESEKDLGERPVLEGKLDAEEFHNMYNHYGYFPKHITKKISDHEYAGLFIYQMIKGPKPDEIHVTWDGDNILNLANVEIAYAGDWSFQLTLNALEGETEEFVGAGIHAEAAGIDVTLTKMTETPVSTTIYLSEQVDVEKVSMEDEEWRGIQIEYLVTDDLGNEYNIIHYRDVGHSTDFQDFQDYLSKQRITTTVFREEATSVIITPIVNVYKMISDDGTLELVKEPYPIEQMQFDLNK